MEVENYLLTKNDFKSYTTGAFKNLMNDTDFVDVTLACPDEKQVDAHKVVLSSCSPFFKKILLKNRSKDQLIYLKGILHRDLVSILQFMYTGQTEVSKDNLDSFLMAAQELKVEGLVYSEIDQSKNKTNNMKEPETKQKVQDIKVNKFEELEGNKKPSQILKKELKTPRTTKSAFNVPSKSELKCEECQIYLQNRNHFDVHNDMLHKNTVELPKDDKTNDNVLIVKVDSDGSESDNGIIVSEKPKDYTCDTDGCEFITKNKDFLKSHILSLHLGLKKYSPVPNNEDREGALVVNEQTPSPTENIINGVISPFTDPNSRPKHDKADLEIRFFCEICEFGTAHKYNLKRHMTNIHAVTADLVDIGNDGDTLGAEMSAEETDNKIPDKKKRTVEQEIVDPSQLLSCDHCDFTTSHIKSKRRHMMVIHEGKRHPCDHCSFQATQPYDLKKHMAKRH